MKQAVYSIQKLSVLILMLMLLGCARTPAGDADMPQTHVETLHIDLDGISITETADLSTTRQRKPTGISPP